MGQLGGVKAIVAPVYRASFFGGSGKTLTQMCFWQPNSWMYNIGQPPWFDLKITGLLIINRKTSHLHIQISLYCWQQHSRLTGRAITMTSLLIDG